MPPLVDLGYENVGDGFRHPVKKPAGGELTGALVIPWSDGKA